MDDKENLLGQSGTAFLTAAEAPSLNASHGEQGKWCLSFTMKIVLNIRPLWEFPRGPKPHFEDHSWGETGKWKNNFFIEV